MIHMVDWNLIETTRGQCSKHKGKGNRKKKQNGNRPEEEMGGKKENPFSLPCGLSLCWRKKKGDGETWPDIPREK